MKTYKTKIINHSQKNIQLSESLEGSGFRYDVAPKKTVEIETTDIRGYLSPFEKIVVTGNGKTLRLKGQKRAGWKDPFKGSALRIEMCNFAGKQFDEAIFVQPGECYWLPRGLPVVLDLQPNTWLEKYKSLRLVEPFIRKVPSKQYPGEIDVQEIPNTEYKLRSEEELETIRKRKEEEKNKVTV